MNKFLIVLMAVCLINVHAFVKRDAPTAVTEKNIFAEAQEKLMEIGKDVSDKFSKTLNPETLKKMVDEGIDTISKGIKDFQKKAEGEKKD